jgi:hypothetical protein
MRLITEYAVAAVPPSKWGLEVLSDANFVTTAKGGLSQERNPMTGRNLCTDGQPIVNWSRAREFVNLGMPNRQGWVGVWCSGQRYR